MLRMPPPMLLPTDAPCPCLNVQSVTRTSSVGPSFGFDLKAMLSSPTSMMQRRMMTLRLLLGSMASVFGESGGRRDVHLFDRNVMTSLRNQVELWRVFQGHALN